MKKILLLAVTTMLTLQINAQSKALARVESEDKMFGFINEKGEMVIPAKFEDAGDFYDGFAAAHNGANGDISTPTVNGQSRRNSIM